MGKKTPGNWIMATITPGVTADQTAQGQVGAPCRAMLLKRARDFLRALSSSAAGSEPVSKRALARNPWSWPWLTVQRNFVPPASMPP